LHYTIYKTTNLINGKIYIGKHQTSDLNDDYLGSGKLLIKAINKYGKENFIRIFLFIFNNEFAMNDKESELVTNEFCLDESNYNMCPGGQGGWGYVNNNSLGGFGGRSMSVDHKNRLKHGFQLWKDENLEVFRLICSKGDKKSFLGKKHSLETKMQMSKSQRGKQTGNNNSQYGTVWITNGIICKKMKKNKPLPSGYRFGRK